MFNDAKADRRVPFADVEVHQGMELGHEVDSEVSAHMGLKVLPCGTEAVASTADGITAAACPIAAVLKADPATEGQASGRG